MRSPRLIAGLCGAVLVPATLAAATSIATGAAPTAAHAPTGIRVLDSRVGARIEGAAVGDQKATPPGSGRCESEFGAACYSPTQIQAAYDTKPLLAGGISGKGETIDVVDSFGSPTLRADVKAFDTAYGLPAIHLRIDSPVGASPKYTGSPADVDWATETTLDVDWAHVMAPGATIRLLETPVNETEGITGLPQMMKAESWALKHHDADVISQSFGATEPTFSSAKQIRGLRSAFEKAQADHVTVLAASGDYGSTDLKSNQVSTYGHRVQSWPSADPLVTSVGGTSLKLNHSGSRTSADSVWNDTYGAGGGGVSSVFGRPSWQNAVASVVGKSRGVPDIAMAADVNGGVLIYTSFKGQSRGWQLIGGTSLATPLFAGVMALADQQAGHDLGDINPALYAIGGSSPNTRSADGLVDVTNGNNGFAGVRGYSAGTGFDLASGWGTVDAADFVPALIAASS